MQTALHASFYKLKQSAGGASRETKLGQREDIKLRVLCLFFTVHMGSFGS